MARIRDVLDDTLGQGMKLRHLVGALALAMTMGISATAAQAQYPPTVANGRVNKSEVKQCQCVQFSGDGFEPGSSVTIVDRAPGGVETVVATVTADTKGEFRVKVCFDEKSVQGEHTLIGRGTGSDGNGREVHAAVTVDGTVCFGKGDEIHNPNAVGGEDDEEQGREGTGSGSGSGPSVGGVGEGVGALPRTGAGYVVPGLLFGFLLVATGTGVVHLTRRRRFATG